MNKHDLIAKIASDTGATKTSAAAAVESLLDGITRALKKGIAKPSASRGTGLPFRYRMLSRNCTRSPGKPTTRLT